MSKSNQKQAKFNPRYADITLTSDYGDEWAGEVMYDPGYEFSCDHCGTEMEDAVGGYWKDDVRYCALCAWDLFDQPKPITAYDIWRREMDEFKRQEDERRRVREEREERERQHMREREEEIEEYIAWREESGRIRRERELMEEEDNNCSEEDIHSTRLTCEYTGPEEYDPRYNYDSLVTYEHCEHGDIMPQRIVNTRSYDWDPEYRDESYEWSEDLMPPRTVNTRSYDWDPKPGDEYCGYSEDLMPPPNNVYSWCHVSEENFHKCKICIRENDDDCHICQDCWNAIYPDKESSSMSKIVQCDCCDGFEHHENSCVKDGTVYCNDCFKDLFNLEMPNLEDSRERYSNEEEDVWDELSREIFKVTIV
jgi:hypothetical protein